MPEAIIAALVGSIPPVVAVIVIAVLQRRHARDTRRQIHEVRLELNGRLSQLLTDHDAAGELRGREDERAREDLS